jgi:transposase-like protein
MPTKPLLDEDLRYTLQVFQEERSNISAAAKILGIHRSTLRHRINLAKERGIYPEREEDFSTEELPDEINTEELLSRRKKDFLRKTEAKEARRLINVRINIDGPIGICHFGDPHVDDDGTDLPLLEKHINLCRDTKGLFAANVGDLQNNWVGRLSHLYGVQSTSAMESWALTEWLINSCDWLYLITGNHDEWSGVGDPLKWMMRGSKGIFEPHGARLNLIFPNGKEVRINARHDFSGHSMWNVTHGPAKAVQMGWRDHILTCGHKHISGYQILKCPMTRLISHAIRVSG